MTDPKLLKEELKNYYNQDAVFYGFNVINDSAALAQTGTGYRTMEVVDAELSTGYYFELGCGDIIKREPNKMSFVIPQNYRSVFAIVKAVTESSGDTSKYMRLMLGYGENGETLREIGRSAVNQADHRVEMTLLGSYPAIVAKDDNSQHKIIVQTYGNQQYNSINILIGVVL